MPGACVQIAEGSGGSGKDGGGETSREPAITVTPEMLEDLLGVSGH